MSKKMVVKSNDLVEAKFDLSLNEQRLILYSASLLDRGSDQMNIIQINVRDLSQILGTTMERYSEFREIARGLRQKEVKIKNGKNEIITGWLSSIEYKHNQGIIELEFSQKLIPYLLQIRPRYTQYELENALAMRSKYSIRLYELMKCYEFRDALEIEVSELRELLMLGDSYKRYYDFDKHVIQPFLAEVNKGDDISVKCHKIKRGNRIHALKFTIKSKDLDKSVYLAYLNKQYKIGEMKEKMGIASIKTSPGKIMELYEIAVEKAGDRGEGVFDYVRHNYLYVKDKVKYKGGLMSYLKKAVENDYAYALCQVSMEYYVDE